MDELKKCPFCNGKRVDCTSMLATRDGWVLYLKCPDCKASFRVLEHVYNTRSIEDAQAAEIERLQAEIDRQVTQLAWWRQVAESRGAALEIAFDEIGNADVKTEMRKALKGGAV